MRLVYLLVCRHCGVALMTSDFKILFDHFISQEGLPVEVWRDIIEPTPEDPRVGRIASYPVDPKDGVTFSYAEQHVTTDSVMRYKFEDSDCEYMLFAGLEGPATPTPPVDPRMN